MNTAGSDVTSAHSQRWRAVRSVLAVRLDNAGDVLMTTPALMAVRASLPGARITLLTSPAGAALAACLPFVDEVIAFAAPWVKRPGRAPVELLGLAEQRLLARIGGGRHDAGIVFNVCTQSPLPAALLLRMAAIPLRLAHCRENPYDLLTDWVPDPDVVGPGMRHEVERQLALVRAVGWQGDDARLRLVVPVRERRSAREKLQAAGLAPERRYFVVHPGASAPSRRYSPEGFGAAAAEIARETGLAAVFAGGDADLDALRRARAAMNGASIALTTALSAGELAALIGDAELLVANNSAPAHVAAAMGTPVVVLYALTNPQHTPWQVPSRVLAHDVPCRNCLKSVCPRGHHDCLARVAPREIVDAALELVRAAVPEAA